MFNILDLLERSATGEPMAVADWDFAVAMAVRRLVKQYGLDWDRAHVVNDDPARANAIFDAALDLALELGVYNYSTGRVVKFTPDELRMGLRRAPQAVTLGEGKDARTLYARRVCDARYPLAWAGTPGTPEPVVEGATPTPQEVVVIGTPTNAEPAPAPTVGPIAATPVPAGVRPASYTLQNGEFPYCIARRFNVDPAALLKASGLTSPDVYYAGLTLTIPQSGAFPGSRMLTNHPTTYTVGSSQENLYSIACKFGDVDPAAIASANSIAVSAKLTSGQQLQIP